MTLSDDERRRIEEEERVRAEARIRAEEEARRKAEGERQAQAAAEQKKTQDKVTKGCLGCVGVIVLLIVIGSLLPTPKDSAPPTPGSDFEAKWVAQSLIGEWERGESGAQHWKGGMPLQSLFAVREYSHVPS